MNASAVIQECAAFGITLQANGCALRVNWRRAEPSPELIARIKAKKAEILLLLSDSTQEASLQEQAFTRDPDPDALAEDWAERTAIIEHEGGIPRAHAENVAWQRVYCACCTHFSMRGCRLCLVTLHCDQWRVRS